MPYAKPFIAWDPIYKHPLPEGHRFPMLKYELLQEQLLYAGIADEGDFFAPEKLDISLLQCVHVPEYYERLLALDLTKAEIRRIGFPLSGPLVERELRIMQGTVDAALVAMERGIGFNVAGGTHHAGSNWGEGFCLLNDQAIAAHYLWKNGFAKSILILDLDVHQGNGTAEIFAGHPDIFTFSMHGQNNFPFKKEVSDIDVGLPDGISGPDYLQRLSENLSLLARLVQPHFVFYQSGVDVLATDKMGKLKLNQDEVRERDKAVFAFCKELNVPVQVSMGGGYSEQMADIVNAHARTFEEGIRMLLREHR